MVCVCVCEEGELSKGGGVSTVAKGNHNRS